MSIYYSNHDTESITTDQLGDRILLKEAGAKKRNEGERNFFTGG
jgi:hypothetical protein